MEELPAETHAGITVTIPEEVPGSIFGNISKQYPEEFQMVRSKTLSETPREIQKFPIKLLNEFAVKLLEEFLIELLDEFLEEFIKELPKAPLKEFPVEFIEAFLCSLSRYPQWMFWKNSQ